MTLKEIGDKFLMTLYVKSKSDFQNGFSLGAISRLLGLTRSEKQNIVKYLSTKGLIDPENGFGDNVLLSPDGIDYIEAQREKKSFVTIKFIGVNYLNPAMDGIQFLYYYCVISQDGKSEDKIIKVSISGTLSSIWGFRAHSPDPQKEYPNLVKILLQYAKDKIIEKLLDGTLTEYEEILLLTTTHPLEMPYAPENLTDIEHAEFEIELMESDTSLGLKTEVSPKSNHKYDVGLSFAGENRSFVEAVANELSRKGISCFYDNDEQADLWGKDIYQHLSDLYKNQCKYCIIFISKEYAQKRWTQHELKAAQARAFEENREYILPIRFDSTEIPGIHSTIGYLDGNSYSPKEIADIIWKKINQN